MPAGEILCASRRNARRAQNKTQNFNQHVAETGLPSRHKFVLIGTHLFRGGLLVAKGVFRVKDSLGAYRPLVVN